MPSTLHAVRSSTLTARAGRGAALAVALPDFYGETERRHLNWRSDGILEPLEAPKPELGSRYVAVAPIARAVIREVHSQDLAWSSVAAWAGFIMPSGRGDMVRLLRRLGIHPYRDAVSKRGDGAQRQSLYINRDVAAKIVRAVHLYPCDFGL